MRGQQNIAICGNKSRPSRWHSVSPPSRCKLNEEKYYFLDRAAFLRGVAQQSLDPQSRQPCLKAAARYDALAEKVEKEKGEERR